MTARPAAAPRGVWATVLLSLRDGAIDLEAIDAQVAAYAAAGADGVYFGGTAAEIHAVTDDQYAAVSARTAAAARAAGVPFQIGAAHPLPQGSLARIAVVRELAPAAIQVTLPDWTPIDLATARRFLEGCAETAGGVPLVLYNPPQARTVLAPAGIAALARDVPTLVGLKCGGGDAAWYAAMAEALERISVFIPGHHYASGLAQGAHGSYSNMACLNPTAAVAWARQAEREPKAARELESRIAAFMDDAIRPLLEAGFAGYACDKAMAAAGDWCGIAPDFLWPYPPVPDAAAARISAAARRHIPEFMPA